MYALTETNYLMRIDPANLNITKRLSVTKCISTSKTIIAHPHVLEDGSWIDMGMNPSVPGYEFVHYDGSALKDPDLDNILENGKVINCIPSSRSLALSYFHSFGLTENYIIYWLYFLLIISYKESLSPLAYQSDFDTINEILFLS